MNKKIGLLCCWLLCGLLLSAQEYFPLNGVKDARNGHYLLYNAMIVKADGSMISNGSLEIKEGKIVGIGSAKGATKAAVEIDINGKYIYPSFVDIYSSYGMPDVKKAKGRNWLAPQQLESDKKGPYGWNQALRPEVNANEHFTYTSKSAEELLKLGFGVVSTHEPDGISRGTAALVSLAKGRENKIILKDKTAHHFSFKKGSSAQSYPGSLMGCIALIKQTYLDGEWYKNHGYKEELDLSLAAWNEVQALPQIFAVGDKLEALRALKLGKENNKKYIIKGAGDEYQRMPELKRYDAQLIIPLDFPEAYDMEDPYDAQMVSLSDLKHWELAPANAAYLAEEGIDFAFTADGLKKKSDYLANIRKAIKHGLSEKDALYAMTAAPAKMIGAENMVGDLKAGLQANFIVTDGKLFEKDSKILQNWAMGKPNVYGDINTPALAGSYDLKIGDNTYKLEISGKNNQKTKIVVNDTTNIKVKTKVGQDLISLSFIPNGEEKYVRLSGAIDELRGRAIMGDGSWTSWSAVSSGRSKAENKKEVKKEKEAPKLGEVTYPFVPFGWTSKPKEEHILLKNATVWTNESDGILENADVLIKDGKIAKVGKDLSAGGATEVDATGKHVTCGVVDEHSHIAISRGVNECTQASTAEVTIEDVVDSDDIDIYRQLAGGVTTSQLLHGSCNPIGGRSAIIKLRWGASPEEMLFEGADGFIKFALGENVKKSRAPSNNRFPDTRMGVEQVYVDHFTRAKDYKKKKAAGGAGFRKDIEMEVINEVLDSKRFISCHSYVQSEINMLMHVAEDFDFRVNTFTHILEGYKVADKMALHGAGGSSFSDWWAYKYEVIDAIPQNGEIMHEQGVTVAFNSDDAEMARRLNQEAAKAVLYGDISEEEAWKFVTLNPAKLLHIDNRVGSLKPGKDADVVLWSDHPMSVYAKAEMTFVDGVKYYDLAEDTQKRAAVQSERARLVQKMLSVKNGGGATQKPSAKVHKHYHCDTDEDEMY
jgi:imidazolonepropionase-like amidohydrolase